VALPAPGQPTTHILKPPIARFPGTTENEAFSMQLAAAIGLDVAAVEPRKAGDRAFLLIRRYDRAAAADGKVRRLHQEDFCQALGIASDRKYAAVDVLRLLDAAIFNVAVGNADAHGKNFSFLHTPDGIALAPLYDLMMTVVYPNLSPKLAMKIARRATLEEIDGRTWTQFAVDAGLGAVYVRRRVRELAEAISAQSRGVAEAIIGRGFDGATLEGLESLARTRSAKLIAKLKEAD
jgi:serine/threonine-protein kinase HipA